MAKITAKTRKALNSLPSLAKYNATHPSENVAGQLFQEVLQDAESLGILIRFTEASTLPTGTIQYIHSLEEAETEQNIENGVLVRQVYFHDNTSRVEVTAYFG